MKISLTTLAVLLSAAAVHALPVGPPVPPPTISDEMSDNISNVGDAGSLIIGGLIQGIPKIAGDIADARARKKAWHTEQERLKAEEDEKKWREALDARLKIAEDKLEHAEALQSDAEDQAKQACKDHDDAIEGLNKAREELAELAVRQRAAAVEVKHAEELQAQTQAGVDEAEKDLGEAVKAADELREAVAKIEELAASVGIPDEEKYIIDPDKYEKPAPPPEEPEGRKKKHHHHRDRR